MVEVTVGATGHRDIFNNEATYNLTHSSCKLVADAIYPRLEWLVRKDRVTRFISGGALGFDQIFFFAVEKLKKQLQSEIPKIKIENIVAVPFIGQENVWNDDQKSWYDAMLKRADQVIYVDSILEYQIRNHAPGYHPSKMIMRDRYMVDNSRHLVACFDGRKGGGSRLTIEYAKKTDGKIIYRFNPIENMGEEIIYGGH